MIDDPWTEIDILRDALHRMARHLTHRRKLALTSDFGSEQECVDHFVAGARMDRNATHAASLFKERG
jgi:hypothetical protein